MDDVNVDHEVSDAGCSARVSVRGLVSCTGRICFGLHMEFGSDVRSTLTLNYSVTVRHEGCRYS